MKLLAIDKTSKESIIKSLEAFAKDLIQNKLLFVNKYAFSFIDIEVYYWHSFHQDSYVIKHIKPFGELELHRFGIDLSLGNQDKIDHGGILIRGLYDMQTKEPIRKSDVIKSIFNQVTLGNNCIELVEEKSPWDKVFKSKRLNLGNPEKSDKNEYFHSQYKFLAKNRDLFLKYPDKEAIFRESELDGEEIKEILGYNLAR